MTLRSLSAALLGGLGLVAAPVAIAQTPPDAASIAGSYLASSGADSCHILLSAPSRQPELSLVESSVTSGLALVDPGCPSGIGEAALWTLLTEGTVELVLTGFSGDAIWTGTQDVQGGWSGVGADGVLIAIHKI